MAEDFKIAQPLEYYKQFLQENIRPDGRHLDEFRKTLLNIDSISTADGSALLKLGDTMIVCGIKSELAEPSLEEPNRGFFVPNVELSPICSPEYLPGPPSDKAQALSQQVADYVTNSKLLDLTDLCVSPKKLCWVLYADIVCISHDGNLLDAILTAVLAALLNTKLPVMKVDDETLDIQASIEEKSPLNIRCRPVSTTIALFNESVQLTDPTREEEDLSGGQITIIVDENQKISSIYKPGGLPVKEETLQSCFETAFKRHDEVNRLLNNVVETIDR